MSSSHPAAPSLLVFPMAFPIKVMGLHVPGFVEAIAGVAAAYDPAFDPGSVELRPSSAGKYLGITVTVTATSQDMLDRLYGELSAHPMVKVVL